jgi:hypothetical protein
VLAGAGVEDFFQSFRMFACCAEGSFFSGSKVSGAAPPERVGGLLNSTKSSPPGLRVSVWHGLLGEGQMNAVFTKSEREHRLSWILPDRRRAPAQPGQAALD